MLRVVGGEVLCIDGLKRTDVVIDGEKISALEDSDSTKIDYSLDVSGCFVSPGFLDIHTHGAVGVDVNAADEEGFRKASGFMASQGVTGWLCSILTDTKENTLRAIREAVKAIENPGSGAALLGIHLEGPCLAPDYKGAMPEHLLMRKADISLFEEYQKAAKGNVKYITVSPEVDGVCALVPELRRLGIVVAIGHSGAGYADSMNCIKAGASAGTHMANAMRLFHQHEPAIFGALLESDAWIEVICDGFHLHPGALRMFLSAKGWNKVVAVTDSIMAAGLPDGKYKLGENDVIVENSDAKLLDGVRAGSTLSMILALRNISKITGKPLWECCRLMTANPAALMGWGNKGGIGSGKDADLTVFDSEGNVRHTIVKGKIVYSSENQKRP